MDPEINDPGGFLSGDSEGSFPHSDHSVPVAPKLSRTQPKTEASPPGAPGSTSLNQGQAGRLAGPLIRGAVQGAGGRNSDNITSSDKVWPSRSKLRRNVASSSANSLALSPQGMDWPNNSELVASCLFLPFKWSSQKEVQKLGK